MHRDQRHAGRAVRRRRRLQRSMQEITGLRVDAWQVFVMDRMMTGRETERLELRKGWRHG